MTPMTMKRTLLALALLATATLSPAQSLQLDSKGLRLLDTQGRTLQDLSLRAKRWDQRALPDGGRLALLQDADSAELLLVRARQGRLTVEARWPGPGFAVEQLCLYRDAQQGLLQVFLLGERGLSEQWLLHEGRALPLRRLATPLEPAACRVRDDEARLYIAEPGVGLWAYGADAESEGRQLLQHLPEADEDRAARALGDWLASHAEQPRAALPIVLAQAQTTPVASPGDAADDPAIWVHPRRPADSRILATDKKRGLAVYDLRGREIQFLPVGRINNVDLRQGLRYGPGKTLDLAVATQRDEAGLVLFEIGSGGRVRELARLPTGLSDIYGVCSGRNASGGLDVFANDKDGRVQQIRLLRERHQGKDAWRGQLVREIRLASQPEGCVADEATQQLFVGEEKRGVWRLALDRADSRPELVIPVGATLQADVEGLAIYQGGPGRRYLIVSSQGNDSYAVFDADAPHAPRGALRIGINAGLGIDGVSETDGLDVSAANLGGMGGAYAEGLLVVQDGRKRLPQGTQNFKLLGWREVAKTLGLR